MSMPYSQYFEIFDPQWIVQLWNYIVSITLPGYDFIHFPIISISTFYKDIRQCLKQTDVFKGLFKTKFHTNRFISCPSFCLFLMSTSDCSNVCIRETTPTLPPFLYHTTVGKCEEVCVLSSHPFALPSTSTLSKIATYSSPSSAQPHSGQKGGFCVFFSN